MARPKGSPNKITAALKDMIEGALDELGGQAWLVKQARKKPVAFMALLARCIPRDLKVSGEINHTLEQLVTGSFQKPAQDEQRDVSPSSRPH